MTTPLVGTMHNGTIELPEEAREALHVADGDQVSVTVLADGVVTLVGRDPDQAWFWTPEWQAGERQADEDLAAGRYKRFSSEEEFDAYLRSLPAADDPAQHSDTV